MTTTQAHKLLLDSLSQYDGMEANSIARIVLKDMFHTVTSSNKPLSDEQVNQLNEATARLKNGEPIQYVTGWADFYGLRFRVNPDVLIPRQDTEAVVNTCLTLIKQGNNTSPEILDIGTGSGCIAITLASKLKTARVLAIDISQDALAVAEANASLNHTNVGFVHADTLKAGDLPVQGFDLIVSNPPYIPMQEKSLMAKNVLDFEPHLALFVDDEDPLIFYRTIIEKAQNHLYEGGYLVFECNQYSAKEVKALLERADFKNATIVQDLSGADRVVWARL
jgi:release factor glutamine methyltransferase